jgi:ketosteroid isomerase-like protein
VSGPKHSDQGGPSAPRRSSLGPDPGVTRDNEWVDQTQSVVARWLAAGDAGDVQAFDDLLHRDVVVHAPRGLSTEDLGSEKQMWREALAAMPDLHHEVQEVVTQGGVEVARVIVTGTLRHDFGGVAGTGRAFRMDQAVICHLRDGKIAEAWEIADVASLDDQTLS